MNMIDYPLPNDWRGKVMTQIRKLMKEADEQIVEEIKWRKPTNPQGNLVWTCNGIISTGEIYKQHLRLTLPKGVELKAHDPKGIINAHRAILIHENDEIDEEAFKDLIREAVKLNFSINPLG